MSAGPEKSLITQEIDAWLLAVKERRAALHIKAASPWHTYHLHEAFTEMSTLLYDALEKVRVVSEQLRERSQAARQQSADLQEDYHRLRERRRASTEDTEPCVAPAALEMFRDGNGREKQGG